MNKNEKAEMLKIYEENKNKYEKAVNEYNKYEDLKYNPNTSEYLKTQYNEMMTENMAIVLNLQSILHYFEKMLNIEIKDGIVQYQLNPIGKYTDYGDYDLSDLEKNIKINNELECMLIEKREY